MDIIEYIREKLSGKKTYIVAIVAMILAGLQALNILPPELPEWLKTLLIALGLGGARAGIEQNKNK